MSSAFQRKLAAPAASESIFHQAPEQRHEVAQRYRELSGGRQRIGDPEEIPFAVVKEQTQNCSDF